MILTFRLSNPEAPLIMWKSDIAEAYRLMPLHPYWQIKQINTVDGKRYIDRNNAFGSSASGAIFIAFNSLITWIAKRIIGIGYIATYVDDSSGIDILGDNLLYEPYEKEFPRHQTMLLKLWDDLGIPHKLKKQVSGSPLTIIGIDVDPNKMTLSLSREARDRLLDALQSWAIKPRKGSHASYQLKHWQQMAGWFNWALNVFPMLRPALNNFYPKTSGEYNPHRKIWVNNSIREDVFWAIHHIKSSNGVHLLESKMWNPDDADWTIFCDACPDGMGFFYPNLSEGYHCGSIEADETPIFYLEALCVLCALDNMSKRAPKGSRVVIYTDNMNTVQIFNSLRCLPQFNPILKAAVDITLLNNIKLRVLHVSGKENIVADALSRSQISLAVDIIPEIIIHTFEPPR